MLVLEIPERGPVEDAAESRHLEQQGAAALRGDSADDFADEVVDVGDVLERVPADDRCRRAGQVGRRVVDLLAGDSSSLGEPVEVDPGIDAVSAPHPRLGEQAQEVSLPAADFHDELAGQVIATDPALGEIGREGPEGR